MLGGVALLAAPEVVSLSSGERLVGEVLPQSNEHTLVLQSALLGELRLPRAQIVQIEAQAKPAPVVDAEVARRDALGASVSTAAVVEMVEQEQAIIDRMRELRAPEPGVAICAWA
jgi:hypothetical protein